MARTRVARGYPNRKHYGGRDVSPPRNRKSSTSSSGPTSINYARDATELSPPARPSLSFGVRPTTRTLFHSNAAPWTSEGCLPPGIDAELVSTICHKVCAVTGFTEAHLLTQLGAKRRVNESMRDALRRALDSAETRNLSITGSRGTHTFLSMATLYAAQTDKALYESLFPTHSLAVLRPDSIELAHVPQSVLAEVDNWDPEGGLDQRARLVCLASWAFAVARPELTESLLEPMVATSPAIALWFGVTIETDDSTRPALEPQRGATSASPQRSAEASDVLTSAESAVPARSADDDPFVRWTRPLLHEIGERHSALASAVDQGRYQELSGLASALDRARVALKERLTQKERELGAQAGTLPEPAPKDLATPQGLAEWLRELVRQVAVVAQRQRLVVDDARSAYQRELSALSLLPPPELAAATSLEQLRIIFESDASRVREARFRRELRQEGTIEGSLRDAIDPARRQVLYIEEARRAETPSSQILGWLERDAPAVDANRARCARDLLTIVGIWINRGAQVPSGTWSLVHAADNTALSACFEAPDFAEAVALADVTAVSGLELARILAPGGPHDETVERLAPPLRRFVQRIQCADMDPIARVRVLSRLAEEVPSEARSSVELARTLAALGRFEHAWLLLDALVRARHLVALPDDLRPSLLAFIALRAHAEGSHHAVLSEFVDNDDWVGDDLDALTVLLFAAVRTSKGRAVLFRHARHIPELETARPQLMRSLLRPRLEGEVSRLGDPQRQAAWRAGHDALQEWDSEIQKLTCYKGWRYAEDYQREFRSALTELLERVGTGGADDLASQDPKEMVADAERAQGLPPVKHPALGIMTAYLAAQLTRAARIRDAVAICDASLSALRAHAGPPDRDELAAEAASPRNKSESIAVIYRHALAEVR